MCACAYTYVGLVTGHACAYAYSYVRPVFTGHMCYHASAYNYAYSYVANENQALGCSINEKQSCFKFVNDWNTFDASELIAIGN